MAQDTKREARLAAALRANLRRRKAAAPAPSPESPSPVAAPSANRPAKPEAD